MTKKTFEEKYWAKHSQRMEERHRLAKKLTGKVESLLDIGCGDGIFLANLDIKRKKGIDLSEKAIQKARKRGLDVQVVDFENEDLSAIVNKFAALDNTNIILPQGANTINQKITFKLDKKITLEEAERRLL